MPEQGPGLDKRGKVVGYLLLDGKKVDILRDLASNYLLADARGTATEAEMQLLVARYGGLLWNSPEGFFAGNPLEDDGLLSVFTDDGLPRARVPRELAVQDGPPGAALPNWLTMSLLVVAPLGLCVALMLGLTQFAQEAGGELPFWAWGGAAVLFAVAVTVLWRAVGPGGFSRKRSRRPGHENPGSRP